MSADRKRTRFKMESENGMPYVYPSADELIDKCPVARAGETGLRAAVQEMTGVSARSWKQGASVKERPSLARGTAIAMFDADGRYAAGTAIFLSHTGSGMWVLDQHRVKDRVTRRHIAVPKNRGMEDGGTWPNASNNALAFSIIER